MKQFQSSKNGYNKEDVDAYISEMSQQLETKDQEINKLKSNIEVFLAKQKEIKTQQENISLALTAAVEKAKQIEKSSYNVYQLKIQELEILYARWESVLNDIIEKYPNLEETSNVKKLLADFKYNLKASVKEDFRFTPVPKKDEDPMKALLNKINSYFEKQVDDKKPTKVKTRARKQLPKDMHTKQTELEKLEDKTFAIKPIYEARAKKGEKYVSLLDKFLTDEATPDSAYANSLTAKVKSMPQPNETGFDLKEAVNPKDSLEQIMQSFDFFVNN